MSIAADIMSMFRSAPVSNGQLAPQQSQQGPVPGAPGNLPQQQPQMQGNNGQLSSTEQIPAGPNPSPMDEFTSLWNTPKPKEGEVQDAPITFNVDPTKVMEQARKMKFTNSVTPESLEKMAAGGPEGVQEMLKLIDAASQQAFAQSAMTSTKVFEQGLESSYQRATKQLPSMVRKETIGQALREDNPLFTNPATAPILQAIEAQLIQQHPNATTAQIKAHAQRYLSGFANEIQGSSPQAKQERSRAAAIDQDWSDEPV